MELYKFKVEYIYDGKIYDRIYTKFCKYPKKTKLYKNLMYLLEHDNKIKSFTYGVNIE